LCLETDDRYLKDAGVTVSAHLLCVSQTTEPSFSLFVPFSLAFSLSLSLPPKPYLPLFPSLSPSLQKAVAAFSTARTFSEKIVFV